MLSEEKGVFLNNHASEDQNFRVFRNDLSVTQDQKEVVHTTMVMWPGCQMQPTVTVSL